jgi:hypothetical protein
MKKSELRQLVRECLKEELNSRKNLKEYYEGDDVAMEPYAERQFKFSLEEVNAGDEHYRLVLDIDGKRVATEDWYSLSDALLSVGDFYVDKCEEFGLDTRCDGVIIDINAKLWMAK